MRPTPTKARPLAEALRGIGATLEAWQVRALFLGAQASTNPRIAPQHLLGHICRGGEPVLGKDLADANANLGSLMALWNELVEDHEDGRVRLSTVRVGKPATAQAVERLILRRNEEITWFLRGIDAAGTNPMELGKDGERLFRKLAEGSSLLDSFQELAGRASEAELAQMPQTVAQLTGVIENIMQDLLTVSDGIRRQAIDALEKREPVRAEAKVGRNDPCPCGSGRKWKKCCGAPPSVH